MINKMSQKFYGWAKGWLVFVLFLLDGFFGGFLLPLIQGMMQDRQGGVLPLDLMLFANPEKIFSMIARYGEFNRPFYILPQPIPVLPVPPDITLPHKSSIPAPNHPWRRSPIGKAKFFPHPQFSKN